MRDVQTIREAWESGVYVGDTKFNVRCTVEKSYFLRQTDPVVGQWTRGPARWYQRLDATPATPSARNSAQVETEIPQVASVQLSRSLDSDAATCSIIVDNFKMPEVGEEPEIEGQFGIPGYFSWSRGESREARTRWNQAPNQWSKALVPNALIRVYMGFGGEELTIPDAVDAGNILLYGVFLVDRVTVGADMRLTLQCRDMAKLLIDQQLFPPLVPRDLYPLHHMRYTYEQFEIPPAPEPKAQHDEITQRAEYATYGEAPHSSSDNYYGGTNTGVYGHRPSDALDWSFNHPPNAGPGQIAHQRSYWLSEPHDATTDFVWVQYCTFGMPVNMVYVHTWVGPMKMYVSVMENGEWVSPEESGQGGLVPSGEGLENIPFVMKTGTAGDGSWPPGPGTNKYTLPRTYYADMIRITFSGLKASQVEGLRGGIRKFVPIYNKTLAEHPVLTFASAAFPYNETNTTGYWQARSDGLIWAFGDARTYEPNSTLTNHEYPLIAMKATPTGLGYWTLDYSGRVVSYGDAEHYGDLSASTVLNVVDIAPTPDGLGYWLLQKDGTVTAYGSATDLGDAVVAGTMPSGARIKAEAIESHPSTEGYWILLSDGEVQEFGLTNHGSANRTGFTTTEYVSSLTTTHDGGGYWITSGNGIVQAFGNAVALGNAIPYSAEKWVYGMCWDFIPYSLSDNGYAIQHADGTLYVLGDFEYFGSIGAGEGQLRKDGTYRDYTDIVKELLLWSGFYRYQYPYDTGMPAVYGNLESTGSFSPEPLPDEMFDKRPVIAAINQLKEAVGYIFYIDEEGAARFESPNWWSPGNWDFEGNRLDYIPEIDERLLLTGASSSFADDNARSEIIISSVNPTEDFDDTVVTRITPEVAEDLKGLVKPAMWVNGVFTDHIEQKVMADLISMHIWFARRQSDFTCPPNPLIGVNDQVRVYERTTGETYVHYVRGVSISWERSGNASMTLTTHWMGGAPTTEYPLFFAAHMKPDGLGYWQAASDGEVFAFGTAELHDANEDDTHTEWVVGIRPTLSGDGYWTVDVSGKVISYGDAEHFGDIRRAELDVRDFAITPTGEGYWILAETGEIFAFGDATSYAAIDIDRTMPVTGRPVIATAIESHPTDMGVWVLASDGMVTAYDLEYYGDADGTALVGSEYYGTIRRTATGLGYYIPSGGGVVTALGSDALSWGDGEPYPLNQWVFGLVWEIMPTLYPGDSGYALQHADGNLEMFHDFPFEGAVGSNSGYAERQRVWAVATRSGVGKSPLRNSGRIITVSDEVMAALSKTGSPGAQEGVGNNFNEPTEPTFKARTDA